jgi:hypothetical protein
MSKSLGERFWEKVDCAGPTQPHMDTCCWEWNGCKNARGYGQIRGKTATVHTHRLSLAFVLGREPSLVMHICDNPACLRPSHLKESSQKENMEDCSKKNRIARGEKHGSSKLTSDIVRTIRKRQEDGELYSSLSESYGVSRSLIGQIVRRELWAHVE